MVCLAENGEILMKLLIIQPLYLLFLLSVPTAFLLFRFSCKSSVNRPGFNSSVTSSELPPQAMDASEAAISSHVTPLSRW